MSWLDVLLRPESAVLGLLERLIAAPRPDLLAVSKAEVKVVHVSNLLTPEKSNEAVISCAQESLWVVSNLLGGSAVHREIVLSFRAGLPPVPYAPEEPYIGISG